MQYRAELDGLRCLAVLVVIAFHADVGAFSGGFIGVDVFFVLSGYLITALLVRGAEERSLRLRTFYQRRTGRLLPLALFVMTAIAACWWLTTSVVARMPLVDDLRASALYVANWRFADQATDYFAIDHAPSPFLHFWSLAVEEQFYVAWPLIVVGIFALGRRFSRSIDDGVGRRAVGMVALVAAVASLASAFLTSSEGHEALAYFGTHNRVYQLLGGAALACVAGTDRVPRSAARALGVLGLGGLFFLTTPIWDVGPIARGSAAALATLAILVAWAAPGETVLRRAFQLRPVVWIGTISYGVYLWHWPAVLVVRNRVVDAPALVALTAGAASIGLSWLSGKLFEQRLRERVRNGLHPRRTITAGVAVSVAVGLVLGPAILQRTDGGTHVVAASPEGAVPPGEYVHRSSGPAPRAATVRDERVADPESSPPVDLTVEARKEGPAFDCLEARDQLCLMHRGSNETVVVVGDSHLLGIREAMLELARRHDHTLYTAVLYLCPWVPGVVEGGHMQSNCARTKKTVYERGLPRVEPDVVVIVNRGYDDPNAPTTLIGPDDELRDARTVLETTIPDGAEQLLEDTDRLLYLAPWPSLPFDQRDCLASASKIGDCIGEAAGPLASTELMGQLATNDPRISIGELAPVVCPRLPLCDPVVDGEVVRWDKNHLNQRFGAGLADRLDDVLRSAGLDRDAAR